MQIYPNGIVFNSPTADQDIYSPKANVRKANSYTLFQTSPEYANTFSTIDIRLHAKKRKILSAVLASEKFLKEVGAAVTIKHVDRWNEVLMTTGDDGTDSWSEPRNLRLWTDCMVFDIQGQLCFSRSLELKEPGWNELSSTPHAISLGVKAVYTVSDMYPWIHTAG